MAKERQKRERVRKRETERERETDRQRQRDRVSWLITGSCKPCRFLAVQICLETEVETDRDREKQLHILRCPVRAYLAERLLSKRRSMAASMKGLWRVLDN